MLPIIRVYSHRYIYAGVTIHMILSDVLDQTRTCELFYFIERIGARLIVLKRFSTVISRMRIYVYNNIS